MPTGELLAAWSEKDVLALVVTGACHGLWVAHVGLSTTEDLTPVIERYQYFPGLGSLMHARRKLCMVLVSSGGKFVAFVESHGRNCVSIFCNPEGASKAPTAMVDLSKWVEPAQEPQINGAFLLNDSLLIFLRDFVIRYELLPVKIEEQTKAVPDTPLPFGLDRKALLHMLDTHGED